MEHADVVVVGAGVIGAAVAYQLSRRGSGLKILVLEKEKTPCTGSTPLSAGGIRQQFTDAVNIQLSRYAVDFYERMAEELRCEFVFEQHGYLFVTGQEATAARFRENVALQREHGVPVDLVTPAEIQARWPHIETGDLLLGTFCATDGYADPYEATMGLIAAARRTGEVRFRYATPVIQIEQEDGKVTRVVTEHGRIATRWVVDCAGPWLKEVAALGGVDLPAEPVRRCLWNTEPFSGIAEKIPLTIDMDSGFYTRSESGGLLLGLANTAEPVGFNTIVDEDWLPEVIERAVRRMPCLEDAEINRGWAGHYSITPDHKPILGTVPWLEGFLPCGGFSGHGFMHAPSAALSVAETILDGRSHTIDVSSLTVERFRDGRLQAEVNVI